MTDDEKRIDVLEALLVGADFRWGDPPLPVVVFHLLPGVSVGGDVRKWLDESGAWPAARKVNGSATEPAGGGVMPLYGEPLVGLEPTTAPVSDPGLYRTTAQVAPPSDPDSSRQSEAGASEHHPETSTEAHSAGGGCS